MDAIFDTVPPTELAKLPLPPAFSQLPNGVYDQIKVKFKYANFLLTLFVQLIHEDQTLKWSEKRQKVHEIMHTLTYEQRRAAFKNMWFPPMVSLRLRG